MNSYLPIENNATEADEVVSGWFGRMGSGKTLNMTKWAIFFSEITGRKIYAKYHINHPNYIHYDHFKELEEVRNGIICFDEIHTFFDSRDSVAKTRQAFMQKQFTHWFTQTRKMNNSIFYTSQSPDQLEKRIRNNTLYLVWCTKNRYRNEMYEHFYDAQMGFNNLQFLRKVTLTKPYLLYHYYNTKELIKVKYQDEIL